MRCASVLGRSTRLRVHWRGGVCRRCVVCREQMLSGQSDACQCTCDGRQRCHTVARLACCRCRAQHCSIKRVLLIIAGVVAVHISQITLSFSRWMRATVCCRRWNAIVLHATIKHRHHHSTSLQYRSLLQHSNFHLFLQPFYFKESNHHFKKNKMFL